MILNNGKKGFTRFPCSAFDDEAGRSLTEMMGTLAIMGILAIAGIWMYNSAMDNLRAGTILNEAQKRAVVVAGQIGFQGRTDPTLIEFQDNEFAGGTFSTDVVTSGLYQQFGIHVSNVPKRICQNILNTVGDSTPIRRLGYIGSPTNAITTCKDNNTFLIVYNNDMSSSGSDPEYASGNCGCQTTCGQCVVENGENKCVGECPTNPDQCTQNTDCSGECVGCVIPTGETQGTCQACQRVDYLESDRSQIIETGVYFDSKKDLEIDMNVYFPSTPSNHRGFFFGDYSGGCGLNLEFFKSPRLRMYLNGNPDVYSDGLGNVMDRKASYHFQHKASDNTYVASMNGVSKTVTSDRLLQTTRKSLALFRDYRNLGASPFGVMRVYDMRIIQDGRLVRDLVSVHAPFQPENKQNCLFDRVSQTLFCNQGTGADFTTNLD